MKTQFRTICNVPGAFFYKNGGYKYENIKHLAKRLGMKDSWTVRSEKIKGDPTVKTLIFEK